MFGAHRSAGIGSDSDVTAREAARQLDESSGRRDATPVRRVFVRPPFTSQVDEEGISPLLDLYRGGRNGATPIRVYLALLWRCSAEPFETQIPARFWASLLGLEDPTHRGARTVRRAYRTLQDHDLIRVDHEPGGSSRVQVLREDGKGYNYTLPYESYGKAKRGKGRRGSPAVHEYFKVNSSLWTSGKMQQLSGPGLVMLLILLAEQGVGNGAIWFSTEKFKQLYALSPKTRSDGTKDLLAHGLIRTERTALNDSPAYLRRRYRTLYYLVREASTEGAQQ